MKAFLRFAGLTAMAIPLMASAPDHDHRLGTVALATSCGAVANAQVQRGLSLLHHMMYEDAASAFESAARSEAGCAMAYWGQSMALVHPLWSDPPDEDKFIKGAALAAAALRQPVVTPRERAYIEAIAAYYAPGKSARELPNLQAFDAAWTNVHRRFPEDPEAALFHALGQLATAAPTDKTYEQQKRAGALIESVFARFPDHPGAHHYLIHAYDVPALASRALSVAREYGNIAPEVPHALHMPSHIFTRLGKWEEAIDWNERSAAAALRRPVDGAVSLHYLHALDYLVYAYLQSGQDAKAEKILAKLRHLRPPVQTELAVAYAFAAIPARLALERRNWRRAASINVREPDWYPWEGAPAVEAISHFARAMGAVHTGNGALAKESLDQLAILRDKAAESSAYWATQVEIQRLSALAWLRLSEGSREAALSTMRSAAALEASTEKHPVTPGEVLPARELLADMLMALRDYAAAHKEYAQVLVRSPNRAHSVDGRIRAERLSAKYAHEGAR
jgi:hypothetical protein